MQINDPDYIKMKWLPVNSGIVCVAYFDLGDVPTKTFCLSWDGCMQYGFFVKVTMYNIEEMQN